MHILPLSPRTRLNELGASVLCRRVTLHGLALVGCLILIMLASPARLDGQQCTADQPCISFIGLSASPDSNDGRVFGATLTFADSTSNSLVTLVDVALSPNLALCPFQGLNWGTLTPTEGLAIVTPGVSSVGVPLCAAYFSTPAPVQVSATANGTTLTADFTIPATVGTLNVSSTTIAAGDPSGALATVSSNWPRGPVIPWTFKSDPPGVVQCFFSFSSDVPCGAIFTNFDEVRIVAKPVSTPTTVTLTVTLTDFFDEGIPVVGNVIATATITVLPSSPNFRLKAMTMPPNGAAGDTEERQFAAGATAVSEPFQLNLGELFGLKLVQVNADGLDGAEVPIQSVTLGTQTRGNPPIPSDLFSNPTVLFPNNVLLPFTSAPTEFFPIHSGTATLNVSFTPPGASSQTSVDVPVMVSSAMPFTLGQAPSTFDTLIVGFADLRGIPPQILKSQVQHESGFRADSYRYEPLTVDFASVSMGSNLRVEPKFAPWRLQTFDDSANPTFPGLPQGDGFAADPDALELRTRFKVAVFSNNLPVTDLFILPSEGIDLISLPTRTIVPGDPPVSMENILFLNDEVQNWIWDCNRETNQCKLKPSFKTWFRLRSSESLSSLQPPGLFTGQVVIAASYGLIHPLYTTAVDPMNYTDASGGGRSPSDLFKPEISLDLGTEYLAFQFATQFGADPQIVSETDFEARFKSALRQYNPGASVSAYAAPIIRDSKNYFPARP